MLKPYHDFKSSTSSIELQDLQLILCAIYFQQEEYKTAVKIMRFFNRSDQWYADQMGQNWAIKLRLTEILLHIDLNNIDLVESKLRSFKKAYFKTLTDSQHGKVVQFVHFIEEYSKKGVEVKTVENLLKIESSLTTPEVNNKDIFWVSFYAWLKARLKNEKIYDITLDIIRK